MKSATWLILLTSIISSCSNYYITKSKWRDPSINKTIETKTEKAIIKTTVDKYSKSKQWFYGSIVISNLSLDTLQFNINQSILVNNELLKVETFLLPISYARDAFLVLPHATKTWNVTWTNQHPILNFEDLAIQVDTQFVSIHRHDSNSFNSKIVDYKSDKYHIALGENYKTTEKLINWTWASEEDLDGRIDSTESDAFLSLDETLVQYNNQDWLPALFIQTYKNRITSFTCSILFELADSANAEIAFLQLLSHDIERLKNKDVLTALSQKGVYEIQNENVIEELKLTKGQDLHLDKFEYNMRQR